MKLDLLDLVRQDALTQARIESYGLDPSAIEEYLEARAWHVADPTATEAIANVMREQKRRRA